MFLTNLIITESLIIDSIKELSSNSAAGPDGIPASLFLNCASELAPSLLILFEQSLDSGVIDPYFKNLQLSLCSSHHRYEFVWCCMYWLPEGPPSCSHYTKAIFNYSPAPGQPVIKDTHVLWQMGTRIWPHDVLFNGKASSSRNTNGICSSVPGSGAGSGRTKWPHPSFCPKVERLNTPPSLFHPGLPISTRVKQYRSSQTANNTILCVPL